MTVLSFKVTGSSLVRTDMNRLVTFTRNNAAAKFELDSEWEGVSPVVAQFRRNDECCYDVFVENGVCAIPWEVLEEKGTLYVSVMGGDLITTNCVNVSVIDTGIVGGLVPTKASPSVYSYIVETVEKMEESYGDIIEKAENIEKFSEDFEELKNKINELESSVKESFENVNDNIGLCNEAIADETERAEEKEEELKKQLKEEQLNMLIVLSGGLSETVQVGDDVYAYICNNENAYIIGSGEMYNTDDGVLRYCKSNIASVYIFNGITNLGDNIFSCCNFESAVIGDDIISIGNYAFETCGNLTSVNIPENVTSIGDYAFCGCTSITSIVLPESLISIGESAFDTCTSLINVNIPENVTSIGDSAFVDAPLSAEIIIPKNVTEIGRNAFRNCSNLTTITINKEEGSISGAPWGATNATVVWTGGE